MGPTGESGVVGFFLIIAIFVAAMVVVPIVVLCLRAKGKKTLVFGLIGLPLAAFLLFMVGSILVSMNAVERRGVQNESLRRAMNAIEEYYRISPASFVRGSEDDEVDIIGFPDWLTSSNANGGVFTDGGHPADASKRRIRVAIDSNNDFTISAFGMRHTVCDPTSVSAKHYIGGLCFSYHDEEGNLSWQTRAITHKE